MSSCVMLTLIFIFITSTVSETSYKLLPTRLPKTLGAHITGIYKNTLFLFGGNADESESSSYQRTNMNWYKLDLKSLQMSLNANKTDVTSVAGSWVQIQGVIMPDYGPQRRGSEYEGQFWCARTQCSAVINQYLFVVVPGHYASPYGKHRYIYRIDLSQDPPLFANETDFQSNITGNGTSGTCVTTDGTDLYYAGGYRGITSSYYDNNVYKYDVSADNHQLAFAMSGEYVDYKIQFGCAWNHHMYKQDSYRLYFFRGHNNAPIDLNDYEYYDTTTQTWSGSITLGDGTRREINSCINNPFTSTIECATGRPATGDTMTLINGNSFDRSVTLYQTVYQYTMEHYVIHLTATEGCAVMFVLGGKTDSGIGTVFNYIQYAVRCAIIDGTNMPSMDPTIDPTNVPTQIPTVPSSYPTYHPTIDPTNNPTSYPTLTPSQPTIAPTSPRYCNTSSHMPDIMYSISVHRSVIEGISWEFERSFLRAIMVGSSQYGGGIGIQTFGDTATDLLGGVLDITDDAVFDTLHYALDDITVTGTDGNDLQLAIDLAITAHSNRDTIRQALHVVVLNADPTSDVDICAGSALEAKQANIRTYVIAIGEDRWDLHKRKLECLVQDPLNDIFIVDPLNPFESVSEILSILCDKQYEVKLTEIKPNGHRFIEGYNFGTTIATNALQISWTIDGTEFTSSNTRNISQGSFFVFENTLDPDYIETETTQFYMDFVANYSKVNWSVTIKLDTDPEYTDTVTWSADSFPIEKNEYTYNLRYLGYNNDYEANWQMSCTEVGTPELVNTDEQCFYEFYEGGLRCSDYLCHMNNDASTGACIDDTYCHCNHSLRLWGDGFSCRNFPKAEDGYCVGEILNDDKYLTGPIMNIRWSMIPYEGIVEYFVEWETSSGVINTTSVGAGITTFTTNDFETTNITTNYANVYAQIENPNIYISEQLDPYYYHIFECELYTQHPTTEPTTNPTNEPTLEPTTDPTSQPSVNPTQAHVGAYLFAENITDCAVPRCECDGFGAFCCFPHECRVPSKSLHIAADVEEIETDVNIQVFPESLSSNVEIDVIFEITEQSNAIAIEFQPLGEFYRTMNTRVSNIITETIEVEIIKKSQIFCADFDENNAAHYFIQILNCSTSDSTSTPFVDWCETIYPSSLDIFIYRHDCILVTETTDAGDDTMSASETDIIYLASVGFILFMAILVIFGLCHAKCIKRNDFFQVIALGMFGVQVLDTFYDIIFAYELTKDPDFVIGFTWNPTYFLFFIFAASVVFIIVPVLISYVQLTVEIRRKWMKIPAARAWLLRFNSLLYIMLFLCGNSFNATLLMNSNLFSIIIFDLPLNKLQLIEFQTQRVYSVLLFENLPQLTLQALYIIVTGGRSNVVYISMTLSFLSVIISITTSMQQKEIIKSQNATKVTFEIEGKFDVNRSKTRVNDIKTKCGRMLGVDPNVILIPKPVEISNGLQMTLFVLLEKEKSEKMKFDEKMHNAKKSGDMLKIVEGSWKTKDTQTMKVKNMQCSYVVPGQTDIMLPRRQSTAAAEEEGPYVEMEEMKPAGSANLEDDESDEYHAPMKVNWRVKAKEGLPESTD